MKKSVFVWGDKVIKYVDTEKKEIWAGEIMLMMIIIVNTWILRLIIIIIIVFTPMPKVPPLSRTQITKKKLRAATKEWKGNYGNFPASVHESNGVGSNNHVKYTKIPTKQG